MSSSRELAAGLAALVVAVAMTMTTTMTSAAAATKASVPAAPAASAPAWTGIGRPATAKEIAAWNIDVRPDFQGLPKGHGSVAQGQDVWESKCSSCHGIFGESREFFNPIVGGTTKDDIRTGHAARLRDPAYPERTTMMKLSTVSTLWDFIHRAMPWTSPKSLSVDEVYAVTAYILNMADVLPADFVLSDANIAEAQARLPNRNGMTTKHFMWPGPELGGTSKPDVQGSSCMTNCAAEPKVASFRPDFARNANGNLAEQNRLVGPQRGADTTKPPGGAPAAPAAASAAAAAAVPAASPAATVQGLLQKNACVACHAVDRKVVGPAFADIARKHGARPDAAAYLAGKIRSGGSGVWGPIPMPPQSLSEDDARAIAQWIAGGAR
jgi:cytochrome c